MTFRIIFASLGIFLSGTFACFAQKESNIWYFGQNAGVTFNQGKPAALTDGALNTNEGCSTVCNSQGNLLFYTDGVNVWTRSHKLMNNGTSLNGNYSSTQSALIVPQPGSSLYYIFTTDFQGNSKGLCYSIVDMGMDGGEGEVITKNNQLLASSTEKITAFRNSNSTAVWVVAHEWNSKNFYTYLIDKSGLKAPVISTVGTVHRGGAGINSTTNSVGHMKASPDGKKLALAIYGSSQIEIFDFNSSSGTLSNPVTLNDTIHPGCYGIEFSPDGNLLYATYVGNSLIPSVLVQYGLYSRNVNYPTIIGKSAYPNTLGALQTGPDGKIYASIKDSKFLALVDKPNLRGTSCSYIASALFLNERQCGMGLPNFPVTAVATSQATVPLDKTAFSCKAGNGSIRFDWSSEEEHSLDHYSVVSLGQDYAAIEVAAVKPYEQNTSVKSYYSYDREMAGTGKYLYYQLRKVSSDGNEVPAGTCSVQKPSSQRVSFTNPARHGEPLLLSFKETKGEKYQIRLMDHEGNIKLNSTITGEEGTLEISGALLSPGIHFIVVENNGSQEVLKLLVN